MSLNGTNEVEIEDDGEEQEAPQGRGRTPNGAKGKGKKAAAVKDQKEHDIHIVPPQPMTLFLRLNGEGQLVVHAFPEKSKQEMRDKQQGRAKRAKDPKDPIAEYNGARYRIPLFAAPRGKKPTLIDCFPAMTIKKALVSACRMLDGIPMTLVKQTVFVNRAQDFVPIERSPGVPYCGEHGEEAAPVMREDIVRVGGRAGPGSGTADLRYRPQYIPWTIPVEVTFLPNIITPEQVINLFAYAGFGCGIGENRAEKTGGSWGLFNVQDDEIARAAAQAAADAE